MARRPRTPPVPEDAAPAERPADLLPDTALEAPALPSEDRPALPTFNPDLGLSEALQPAPEHWDALLDAPPAPPRKRREKRAKLELPSADVPLPAASSREVLDARLAERDISRRRKLAFLLSQEVRRLVDDTRDRQALMITLWSKMRARQPFLNLLRTRFEQIAPDDLLGLPIQSLIHLDRFYRVVDEMRLYILTTEDMPVSLEVEYERYRLALLQISRPLLYYLDQTHGYEDGLPDRLDRSGEILEG